MRLGLPKIDAHWLGFVFRLMSLTTRGNVHLAAEASKFCPLRGLKNERTGIGEPAGGLAQAKDAGMDSVSSPITKRVYNLGFDEFFEWFGLEPRPGFTKATVSAWRVALEGHGLGSISINVRITAVRKLAVERPITGCWRRSWRPGSRALN